jgi:mRNA interferase MazF
MSVIQIKRGDVYFADLHGFYGSEQGGCRPVVVIQNDVGNRYSPTTLIAPITSSLKRYQPTHVAIEMSHDGLSCDSRVLCEQVRAIDKKRLQKRVTSFSDFTMSEIDKALAVSFGMTGGVV